MLIEKNLYIDIWQLHTAIETHQSSFTFAQKKLAPKVQMVRKLYIFSDFLYEQCQKVTFIYISVSFLENMSQNKYFYANAL